MIAVNVDIRGFSAFSKTVESTDTAMFIKKVYAKLIDGYFRGSSFVKPTGDGLLIIIPYTENTLQKIATEVISDCLKILVDFGSFTSSDPMINFDVPQKIGIGLSRGSACCLHSGKKVLDYSGRVLNLASRLMDIARPSGIVFDSGFGLELIQEEVAAGFAKDTVYIRGVAESEPIEVYYAQKYVTISDQLRVPLSVVDWGELTDKKTLKELKESALFLYTLPAKPLDPKQIKVRVYYPKVVKGRRREGIESYRDFSDFEYVLEAGKPCVSVRFDALAKTLEKDEVKDSWEVRIRISYPKLPG